MPSLTPLETQGLLNEVYDSSTRALRTTAGGGSGGSGGTGPAPAEVSLLDSAARTADATTSDQTNNGYKGLHLVVRVTAGSSTPSVAPTLQGKDPVSGQYYDLLVGTAITDTNAGTYVYKLYPGITPVPGGAASDVLPRTWRLFMNAADSDSLTYSVGAVLLP